MPESVAVCCADCDTVLETVHPHLTNADDDYICESCHENYCECHDCFSTVRTDTEYRDDDDNPICADCDHHYNTCHDCGDRHNEDNLTYLEPDGRCLCETCLSENYERCDGCGHYVHNDNSHTLAESGIICDACYEYGSFTRCDACQELYHDEDTRHDEVADAYYCVSCYAERIRANANAIQCYSYKPEWEYHHAEREAAMRTNDLFYFGVELEVENTSEQRHANEETAATMNRLAPLICKADGSINNGFEMVFHPHTYLYATSEGKAAIENCLAELRKRNFSGHNFGGMHIHVSRDSFTRLHLVKFHMLFKNAYTLFTKLSQRKAEKLNQWASFANIGDTPGTNYSRYAALNYTENTVEVRIFNSTIRTERFFKNLEVVKAAIDYTKQCSLRELDDAHFLRFIMQNRSRYRNLSRFLVEKHERIITASAIDARIVRQVQKQLTRRAG